MGGDLGEAGGLSCAEAPRSTLFHHYRADEKRLTTKVNLIVATVQNNRPCVYQ